MGDEGDKTCPLCAEEMDFTDQHLKPCKCGYQICVWCWHQIMDMAEKDETEGRCPACRTPYDKENIVRMAAKCERLVAEVNMGRKRSQKAKPKGSKPSDGRKQLSSVRVIQRNLVYIVGLPLDLGDENLLQQKEYFGQYGRALKVSMSRTAAGTVQQFPNNTCSVYITYSKESEAIKCIEAVHGFVLDGRSLKACFGTTKYCHAWLRNLPCTNPDCLYLHEVGSQEDSFTKDEVVSAYSRVQQITGLTTSLQRRSGSMLPPPPNDSCNNSSAAEPILKVVSNSTPSVPKNSPPNGVSVKSAALPAGASWGMRSLNPPSVPSSTCTNELSKEKPGAVISAVANTTQVPVSRGDMLKKSESTGGISDTLHANKKSNIVKPLDKNADENPRLVISRKPASPDRSPVSNHHSVSVDENKVAGKPSDVINSFDHSHQSSRSMLPHEGNREKDGKIGSSCADVATMSANRSLVIEHSEITGLDCSHSDSASVKSPGTEEQDKSTALPMSERDVLAKEPCVSRAEGDVRSQMHSQVVVDTELKEDILSFNTQRLKDPEIMTHLSNLQNKTDQPWSCLSQDNGYTGGFDSNTLAHDNRESKGSYLSYGYGENSSGESTLSSAVLNDPVQLSEKARSQQLGKSTSDSQGNYAIDPIEDSIIASILSLDFDKSLTGPKNLSELLGEIDRESRAPKLSNYSKFQNNNQSRFSFARQEEPVNQAFESYSIFNQVPNDNPAYSSHSESPYACNLGAFNSLSSNSGGSAVFLSNKHSVSRHQVSAPPGFSVPNRSPPPGFPSNQRIGHGLGNHLQEPSLFRNSYQTPPVENVDIELLDPAILAVGQGRPQANLDSAGLDIIRSNSLLQLNASDNISKLQQLYMHDSLSAYQNPNPRFSSIGDNNRGNFSSAGNSYGLSPLAQLSSFQQSSRNMAMPNGQWDGWYRNELPRNESLGLNNFYGNFEGSNSFRMPSSSDIHNRNYRI